MSQRLYHRLYLTFLARHRAPVGAKRRSFSKPRRMSWVWMLWSGTGMVACFSTPDTIRPGRSLVALMVGSTGSTVRFG